MATKPPEIKRKRGRPPKNAPKAEILSSVLPQTALPDVDEFRLLGSICKAGFADFVKEFWHVVVPEKLHWNWHLEYLCDELQLIAERVFKGLPKLHDLVINISPGTSKSTLASVMFPAWLWTHMPTCRVISASYRYDLATILSRKSRDIIKSELYRRCFPGLDIRDDQDAKSHFVNTKGGERFAIGVDGGVMGQHAHIIIVDDPLDPKQAASDADLETTNRWMEETLPSRKVDKEVTPIILIMQRLHEADPTGQRLEKGKDVPVRHICLPAELADNVNPPELRERYVDGLMDPKRLPRSVLREVLAAQGEYVLASQYGQSPVPRGGAMFKVGMIKIRHLADEKTILRWVRYWDKSATAGGGAYTVGLLMGVDNEGHYWVVDVVRGQWDSGVRERKMREVANRDGRRVPIWIEQEPGGGGKESSLGSIKNLAGFCVKAHKVGKSDGDKEARADAFSAQVNIGNVSIVPAEWNAAYLNELKHFPRSRYKDQCLPAGTLVSTRRGNVRVEQVDTDDEVMTRGGWRRVLEAGMTCELADTVALECLFGGVLECTHSHPVWVEGRGFVPAAEVRQGDEVLAWSKSSSFAGTALCGGDTRTRSNGTGGSTTRDICEGCSNSSIVPNGRKRTAPFLPSMRFITKTAIPSTIDCRIWNCSPSPSIEGKRLISALSPLHASGRTALRFAPSPQNGIAVRKAGSGIGSMRGKSWRSGHCLLCDARLVEASSVPSSLTRNSALESAVTSPAPSASRFIGHAVNSATECSSPRRRMLDFVATPVAALRDMRRGVPVFNLKVDEFPEFFAGGILVHNCDASSGAFNNLSGRVRVLGSKRSLPNRNSRKVG